MDTALELLTAEEPDADVAALAAQVGRFKFFAGEPEVAHERIETALDLAESLGLPEVLSQAVNTKAMILSNRGRVGEAGALVRYALEVALEHDIPSAALRGYNNVADLEARSDRYEQAAAGYRDGLALARRVGSRQQEWMFVAQTYPLYALGRWDEALLGADEVPEDVFSQTRFPFVCFLGNSVAIHCHRGELDAAAGLIERYAVLRDSADLTRAGELRVARGAVPARTRAGRRGARGCALPLGGARYGGRQLGVGEGGVSDRGRGGAPGWRHGPRRRAARKRRGDGARPGPKSVRAQAMRFRARMAAAAGDADRADRLFRGAAGLLRELATPFPMAVAMLEHAEWLAAPPSHAARGRAGAGRGAGGVRAAAGGAVARAGRAGRRRRRRPVAS